MKIATKSALSCLAVLLWAANVVRAGTPAYRNTVLRDNPLVYYEFDEISGTTASNSATSGATYVGTLNTSLGSVTLDRASFRNGGTAYEFGGGFVGSASALVNSLTEWTVEAWVNYDSAKTNESTFLSNDQSGWNDDVLFGIGTETGTAGVPPGSVGPIQQGSPGVTRDYTSAPLTAGEWHHVVATGSTAGGALRLYVDGGAVGTPDTALVNGITFNGADGLGTPHLTIGAAGRTSGAGYRPYDGFLDEVAIYGTVLDASTIAAHYNAGVETPERTAYRSAVLGDNPIVYYAFDEPSGTTAKNSATTGAMYDGTLNTSYGSVTLDRASFCNGGTAYEFGGGFVGPASALANSLTEWTVEAWVNYDPVKTNGSHFVSNDQSGWNNDVLFGIGTEDGTFGVPAGSVGPIQQGNPGSTRDYTSVPLTAGVWHHVVATGSTVGGALRLYVDGVSAGTPDTSIANGITFNGADGLGTPHLTIGAASRTSGSSYRSYKGFLDDVAIYDTALDASAIAAHYRAGVAAVPCGTLIKIN